MFVACTKKQPAMAVVAALALVVVGCTEPTGYDGQQEFNDAGTSANSENDNDTAVDADDAGASANSENDNDTAVDAGDAGEDDASNGNGEDPCEGRQPPQEWSQLGDGNTPTCLYTVGVGWDSNADCTTWEPGLYSSAFYETTGVTRRLALAGRGDARQYLAIEIDTENMPPDSSGRLNVEHDPFAEAVSTIISISTCPGDFHHDEVVSETGCYAEQSPVAGGGASFRWGGVDTDESCQLASDETYFINIIPTSSSPETAPDDLEVHSSCEDDVCGLVYEPQ